MTIKNIDFVPKIFGTKFSLLEQAGSFPAAAGLGDGARKGQHLPASPLSSAVPTPPGSAEAVHL